MKRFSIIFVAAVLLAGGIIAATWRTGEGAKLTSSVTHTRYVFSNELFNTLSIYNSDADDDVYCLINTTTNNLVSNITANTAIPVAPGASYTFDAQAQAVIENICHATTNGTAVIYLGGY